MFKKNKKQPRRSRNRQATPQAPRTAVFSYYSNNRVERTEDGSAPAKKGRSDAKPARRRHWGRKTSSVVLIVGVVAIVVVSLIITPQPRIKVLGDRNSQFFLQDSEVYYKAAQQILASSAFNRNKLTFDSSQISQQMRQVFPELAAVSVTLPLVGWEPEVYVQAFTPSIVLIGGSSGDFVLDPEGRAFAPGGLRGNLDKLKVPIVRDQSGLQIDERQIALPSSQVAYITEIYRQLQAKDVPIGGIILPAGAGELEVKIQDKPYTVRFNLYGDAREGAGRYLAAASYLESKGQVPGDYIDVRVDGRVFYK